MYDLLVVGAGPSAFAFLEGLPRRETRRILVVAAGGNEHASRARMEHLPRSPKLRQPRVESGWRAWLSSLPPIELPSERFAPVGVHGIGGSAQFWGSALSRFDRSAIIRSGLDPLEIENAYQAVSKFVPVSAPRSAAEVLREDDGRRLARSDRIAFLDGVHCDGRLEVAPATVAVHASGSHACTGCNKCLSGCSLDSIWAPTRSSFLSLGHRLTIETAFVSEVHPLGGAFRAVAHDGGNARVFEARQIVLAAGPIMNFQLLAPLSRQRARAPLLNCPSFAFALLSRPTGPDSVFGMAHSSFRIMAPDGEVLSAGCLYDGKSLTRYSEGVFFDQGALDRVAQGMAPWFIFGAAYLDSETSEVELGYENRSLTINARSHTSRELGGQYVKTVLTCFGRQTRRPLVVFRAGMLGIDVHYGGGVPTDLKFAPDAVGRLAEPSGISVVGGSLFSYLPPHYPTFSFMAASWSFGRRFEDHRA